MARKSILFVCTANLFRSVCAEVLLKKYLSDKHITGWKVGSAAIRPSKDQIHPKTIEALSVLGVDASHHRRRLLSRKMLLSYDIVVAMAHNHAKFISSDLSYDKKVYLFNELGFGKRTSILDIPDLVEDHKTNKIAVEWVINDTIRHIQAGIPELYVKIDRKIYNSHRDN